MTKRTDSRYGSTATKKAKLTIEDGDPKNPEGHEAPFIKLFAAPTTNGQKVIILLELLGVDYIYRGLNIKEESKSDWYLRLNPAGKIPLLEDVNDEGDKLTVAESGAILLYLASKYDPEGKFSYKQGTQNYWKQVEFILFHASGLNPEQKAYNITKVTDPENKVAIAKCAAAVEKVYQFVEDTLKSSGSGYLVGDHISLADIIAYPHASVLGGSGIDTSKWPLFGEWLERVGSLPGVKAAMEKK